MARGLCVGMVMTLMLITGASRAVAAGSPIYRGPDVKFTTGGTSRESTLIAEGVGVRVTKRIGAEIAKIRIETATDLVDIEAIAGGKVRLAHRGKSVTINLAARDPKLVGQARRMTEGSQALTSFDALITALDNDNRAAATSMRTTWAMVHALRGQDEAAMSLVRRLKQTVQNTGYTPARFTVEREENPVVCWTEYTVTVYGYYVEYAQCLIDYAWIPGGAAVCSFEWVVKSELAWFWVIGCSGGIPV